ncbi:MAG: hypothetical protein L0Z62_41580 [Gemmataceae bacterium]|nr:hypothetical protein [Gemmataceae bacterium]
MYRMRLPRQHPVPCLSSWVRPTLLGFVTLTLCSCQGKRYDPVPLAPVKGKVFFGVQPAAGAEVRFHPLVAPGKKSLFPVAKVEADGSFALTTYENQDGAPPGEYAVSLYWPEAHKGKGPPPIIPPDRLGGRYSNPKKSPWRVHVREGTNELEPFRLP